MPLKLLSWCAFSFSLPHALALCPCFTVTVCPLPPSFPAAWGTDFAADKAAAAASRTKQYPGAHCSTAYATKHGWRQPKGQALRDVSAGVFVSMGCMCHLYPHPSSISVQRIWSSCITDLRRNTVLALKCFFFGFWDQVVCYQNTNGKI